MTAKKATAKQEPAADRYVVMFPVTGRDGLRIARGERVLAEDTLTDIKELLRRGAVPERDRKGAGRWLGSV